MATNYIAEFTDADKRAAVEASLHTIAEDGGLELLITAAASLFTIKDVEKSKRWYLDLIGYYNLRLPWLMDLTSFLGDISDLGTILEVGAGSGVLAKALGHRRFGLASKIICTSLHVDNRSLAQDIVEELSGKDALDKYGPQCNCLLLSWPLAEDWTTQVLRDFKGKYIIYIGELEGVTLTREGEKYLRTEFVRYKRIRSYKPLPFTLESPMADNVGFYIRRDTFKSRCNRGNTLKQPSDKQDKLWQLYRSLYQEMHTLKRAHREAELELAGVKANRDIFACLLGKQYVTPTYDEEGQLDVPKFSRPNDPIWNGVLWQVVRKNFNQVIEKIVATWRAMDKEKMNCKCDKKLIDCLVDLEAAFSGYMNDEEGLFNFLKVSARRIHPFDPLSLSELPDVKLPSRYLGKTGKLRDLVRLQDRRNQEIKSTTDGVNSEIEAMQETVAILNAKYASLIPCEDDQKLLFNLHCENYNIFQKQDALTLELRRIYKACRCNYCTEGYRCIGIGEMYSDSLEAEVAGLVASGWRQLACTKEKIPYPGVCGDCEKPACDFATSFIPSFKKAHKCN